MPLGYQATSHCIKPFPSILALLGMTVSSRLLVGPYMDRKNNKKPGQGEGSKKGTSLKPTGRKEGSDKVTSLKPTQNRSGAAKRRNRKLRLAAAGLSASSKSTEQETAGGSGTKRLRSEGSTPGASGRTEKRPRTSEASYSQAARSELRMAIVPVSYPDDTISEEQFRALERALNEAHDALEVGSMPRFSEFAWSSLGAVMVTGEDRSSLD